MSALDGLKQELAVVSDLHRAAALLSWDQETYMPSGGVVEKANQLATLERLAHERFTSDGLGRLLDGAERETASAAFDSDEASLVRVTRRDLDKAVKLPAELVEEMAREGARSVPVWREARARGDWSVFAPRMRVTVDLSRRFAEALGYERTPYDALIADSEPGLTTDQVEALFEQLRAVIVPLVEELGRRSDRIDDSVLDRGFDADTQVAFALDLVQKLGFDLEHGRQDISAHPFCTSFGPGDVRITTRVKRNMRDSCIFSSIHESGHGMYEQGLPRTIDRTPLCEGASAGVHESQSRLWENLVGRSRPFWEHFYPSLKDAFPQALTGVDAEGWFRANNKVQPSYVRVDADEVTYNLHVMLRFELEKQLIDGRLGVDDVPEAWDALLGEYLGLGPAPAAQGPLQDIHWTFPRLGTFIGYTLGNVISAQLMLTARRRLPDLEAQIGRGEFAPLLAWLRENVHVHGRKFTPNELLERVTGGPITPEPWIDYVTVKFRELYGLG